MKNVARLVLAVALIVIVWALTVAASGPIDSQLWQLFTVVLVVLSPLVLRYAPASWKGFPMLVVAVVVSSALSLLNMYIGGEFNHFSLTDLAVHVAAFAGAQQVFYSALKDALHLADPPAAVARK